MDDEEQKEALSESNTLSGSHETEKSEAPEEENEENPPKLDEEVPKEKRNLLQMLKNKLLSVAIPISEPFSFTREVLRPLTLFMNLSGLHDGHTGSRHLNWHRRILLFYMVPYSFNFSIK